MEKIPVTPSSRAPFASGELVIADFVQSQREILGNDSDARPGRP